MGSKKIVQGQKNKNGFQGNNTGVINQGPIGTMN